jgi:excisionase family DNA binding protein
MALDREASAHLARAISEYRRWCRVNGYAPPLGDIELMLSRSRTATSGHERPTSEVGGGLTHTPIAVTYKAAGELLSVSESTVKRMVARGELRAVSFGRCRRLLRSHLDEVLEKHRT